MITKLALSFLMAWQLHAAISEISGDVTAAKGVRLTPGGVLFIFAKKEGVAMPAAVLRVPDPQLPYHFKMSAENAMAPGTPFDGPFVITARYSPSGDAMDKSGPEGTTGKAVKVGSDRLKLRLQTK